mmetsp:Transcript_50143/g.160461  ORF Transcript_50143/g.160461 Transcript_50143/m.160461 type:complete len:417 (-) Transcript_50143:195-1445(-)
MSPRSLASQGLAPGGVRLACTPVDSLMGDDYAEATALVREVMPARKAPEYRPRYLRDVALLALGAAASALALMASRGRQTTSGGGGPAGLRSLTAPAAVDAPRSCRTLGKVGSRNTTESAVGRYAYVQMAWDDPKGPPWQLWRVLAMARSLQSLSKFPLVLLTNTTYFPDGTEVVAAMRKIDVEVLPVYEVPVPERFAAKLPKRWHIPFWKLQIWRLTQFEKLIWLDTDAILFRSIDWLFQRTHIWGQRDNWICSAPESAQNWLCSGLMLIQPDEQTYQSLRLYAESGDRDWWTNGDQKLIRNYFRHVAGNPVRLLGVSEASFGKCLGQTPKLKLHSGGPWNIPSFIHKSSEYNECFEFNMAKQLRKINGTTVNICHYHPLGPHWRRLFCDAVEFIGVKTNHTDQFCDDLLYYRLA